jgi:hypothetical protein
MCLDRIVLLFIWKYDVDVFYPEKIVINNIPILNNVMTHKDILTMYDTVLWFTYTMKSWIPG